MLRMAREGLYVLHLHYELLLYTVPCFCHCAGFTSVGVDVTFHDVEFVYGIPEHADSLALKSTTYVIFYPKFLLF